MRHLDPLAVPSPGDPRPSEVPTNDLFLAGYLLVEGMELVEIAPYPRFVFRGPGVFERASWFARGRARANVTALQRAIRDLERREREAFAAKAAAEEGS